MQRFFFMGNPQEEAKRFITARLKGFKYDADVNRQLIGKFLTEQDFQDVLIFGRGEAVRYLKAQITWNVANKGNVIVKVWGRQRHGKSTFSRWLARYIHKVRYELGLTKLHPDRWEERVIFQHSYSRLTKDIEDLLVQVKEQTGEEADASEILKHLEGYTIILDEVFIEHEKDSRKAVDDVQNLMNVCAKAGINFIFTMPDKVPLKTYFSVWVCGFSKRKVKKKRNVSFLYDSRDLCVGMLKTAQVLESPEYEQLKDRGILEVIEKGGRIPSLVKVIEQADTEQALVAKSVVCGSYTFTPLHTPKETPDVVPMMQSVYGDFSLPKTRKFKPEHADAFFTYYTENRSAEDIADDYRISAPSLTNTYAAGGWIAIFMEEVGGYLCEEAIRQLYYPTFERLGRTGEADLYNAETGEMVEVKLRRRREKPRVDMLSGKEQEHPEKTTLVLVTLSRRGGINSCLVERFKVLVSRTSE